MLSKFLLATILVCLSVFRHQNWEAGWADPAAWSSVTSPACGSVCWASWSCVSQPIRWQDRVQCVSVCVRLCVCVWTFKPLISDTALFGEFHFALFDVPVHFKFVSYSFLFYSHKTLAGRKKLTRCFPMWPILAQVTWEQNFLLLFFPSVFTSCGCTNRL